MWYNITKKKVCEKMESIYDELKDIHHWHEYEPLDNKYYIYPPKIIYACCKISDLYHQLCNARMSLNFCFGYDEYSMMSKDKSAILLTKKYFLENSLLYYNFSVDYLWQVLWLYYDNSENINKIATNEYYQSSMKQCDFQSLLCGLTEIRENKVVSVLNKFFSSKNETYDRIRSMYNYLKHRAVFHTPDLGLNAEETDFPIPTKVITENNEPYIECYKLPMICRDIVDFDELKKELIKFDKEFVDLCEYLFELLIPKDYLISKPLPVARAHEYTRKHLSEIEEYAQKHSSIKVKKHLHSLTINELVDL